MRFKGIFFRSWADRRQRDPVTKLQWIGGDSTKAQRRRLKQIATPYLTSKDPAVVALLARVQVLVKNEPDPVYGLHHLIWAAWDAADQTGESWVTAATYLIEKFENMVADAAAVSA